MSKDKGILPDPYMAKTVTAIDVYLNSEASFVFLESEKVDLCNLWQQLKIMIEKPK